MFKVTVKNYISDGRTPVTWQSFNRLPKARAYAEEEIKNVLFFAPNGMREDVGLRCSYVTVFGKLIALVLIEKE